MSCNKDVMLVCIKQHIRWLYQRGSILWCQRSVKVGGGEIKPKNTTLSNWFELDSWPRCLQTRANEQKWLNHIFQSILFFLTVRVKGKVFMKTSCVLEIYLKKVSGYRQWQRIWLQFFQRFLLDFGCFFSHFQSSPWIWPVFCLLSHLTRTCESFQHKKDN